MKKIFYLTFAGLMLLAACKDDGMGIQVNDDPEVVPGDTTAALIPADYLPGDTTFGVAYGVLQDSILWVASGLAQSQIGHPTNPDEYFGVQFNTYESEFEFHRENMFLSEIPKSTLGDFKISGGHFEFDDGYIGATFYKLTDDGDVLEDSYEIDESVLDNMLTISSADSVSNIYKGSFNVTFTIATIGGKRNPDNPDIITFKDVSFRVKLQE